nr:nucleotidyltransferase domain-containing protein [uncultured Draconibacterium sp.]
MSPIPKDIIVDFLQKHLARVHSVYLYGSFAKGVAPPENGIDVAFLSEAQITNVAKWKIQEKLAAALNKDVYLVNLKDANVVLRKEIVEKGKLLYFSDQYKTKSFEMTTLSMYLDLNETRKNILNDYKQNMDEILLNKKMVDNQKSLINHFSKETI